MINPRNHFFEFTPETFTDWCNEHRMPAFRGKQVFQWVYEHGIVDPQQMTNLSKRDRELLEDQITFLSGPTVAHQLATDGTQKLLVEWSDDTESQKITADHAQVDHTNRLPIVGQDMPYSNTARQTECVMIPAKDSDRRTACISSQIGCPVGCKFCATGIGGLDGNLSAGRIVEQVWRLNQLKDVHRITNIVFMGMGEPLANFAPVTHAVRTIAAPWGMGISARKITVSTVGMHKAIEKLAQELELPVTLALSLHAPNDHLRRELIPWAEFTTIEQLINACRLWFEKTGREITLEYILLGGVNDGPEHAMELSKIVKMIRANVNLIRYNEVSGLKFERPSGDRVHHFQRVLQEQGVNCHIRASRGRDIAAACGQLRHEHAST